MNMKRGVLHEARFIIIFYLVLYYVINITTIQLRDCSNYDFDAFNFIPPMEMVIKEVGHAERGFTTLLTFFLGFYVSMMLLRWWKQVSGVPTIVEVCQKLHGIVGVDSDDRHSSKKQEQEFKKRIARYCLLSWTMCLSGISVPLKQRFCSEREYIEKGLLTIEEYNRLVLSSPIKATVDGWTDKWFIPLNWAALSLNIASHTNSIPNDNKSKIVPTDSGYLVSILATFQAKLVKLTNYFEIRLPAIQTQVITISVWFFLIIGLIAEQGTTSNCSHGFAISLFLDFPFFQLMKYLLIFGWLRVASYVQLPFGSHEG